MIAIFSFIAVFTLPGILAGFIVNIYKRLKNQDNF